MTLLYLAIAYTVGIVLGRTVYEAGWDAGWSDCAVDIPGAAWLWIAPLGAAMLAPLLDRLRAMLDEEDDEAYAPLRWPESAGFARPREGLSSALIAACVLCLFAGALRYVSAPVIPCHTPLDLAYYNAEGKPRELYAAPRVRVDGYVSSYPTVRDTRQQMVVQVEHILGEDGVYRPVSGLARVSTGIQERFEYGDAVQVVGVLAAPRRIPGSGDWVEYLARQDVYSVVEFARVERRPAPPGGSPIHRALYKLRHSGERLVNRLLPEPYAALANGILLGINSIPQQVRAQFDETGTSHVLVISGTNAKG